MEEKISFQLFQVQNALKKDPNNEKLKRMSEKMSKLLELYKEKYNSSIGEKKTITTPPEAPKEAKEAKQTSKIPLYKKKNSTTTKTTTTTPKATEQQQSWQKFKNSQK